METIEHRVLLDAMRAFINIIVRLCSPSSTDLHLSNCIRTLDLNFGCDNGVGFQEFPEVSLELSKFNMLNRGKWITSIRFLRKV